MPAVALGLLPARAAAQTAAGGLEAVAYAHHRFGEYLAQPTATWRPTKHFFVPFGAGYYEVGGQGQAVFMCRANLLNPTRRKPRED